MTPAHLLLTAAKLRRVSDVLEGNARVNEDAADLPPANKAALNAAVVLDVLAGELFESARSRDPARLSELADLVLDWVASQYDLVIVR